MAFALIDDDAMATDGVSGGPNVTINSVGADLIVVGGATDITLGAAGDITDTGVGGANTWHFVETIAPGSGLAGFYWTAPTKTGASHKLDFTGAGAPFGGAIAAAAFSGTAGLISGTAANNQSGNAPETGAFSTGTATGITIGDLLILIFYRATVSLIPVISAGTDLTLGNAANHTIRMAYDTTAGTSASRNWSPSSGNLGNFPNAAIMAFSPGGAPAGRASKNSRAFPLGMALGMNLGEPGGCS